MPSPSPTRTRSGSSRSMGRASGKKGAVWAARAHPGRRGGGVGQRAAHPRARPEGPGRLHGLGQRLHRWPRSWAGGARRAASRSSSARSTAIAQRAGQPAPRVARAQPPGAVAAARSRMPSTTRCR
ncbi:MAG: hypothetical protein M0C28_45190 [Candidatus Moduliflexus flocculans]|nr:hypothetical protein [Candidatus Moduliflexus flocculans]